MRQPTHSPTMRPNGNPKIMAIDVPATIMPSARERKRSETSRTAIGEAIDQNTAWAHATPIRDASSPANPVDAAENSWQTENKAIVASISFFISMRQTSSISGKDSAITTQA